MEIRKRSYSKSWSGYEYLEFDGKSFNRTCQMVKTKFLYNINGLCKRLFKYAIILMRDYYLY